MQKQQVLKPIEVVNLSRETDPLEDRVLLTEIVRALVAHPENVRITEKIVSKHLTTLHIDVDERDRGQLLGRAGSNISAIRQIFASVAFMDRRNVEIVVNDGPIARPPRLSAR